MQREVLVVDIAVAGAHLGDRVGVAGSKCVEQLLGLALELIEIRARGERAAGRGLAVLPADTEAPWNAFHMIAIHWPAGHRPLR